MDYHTKPFRMALLISVTTQLTNVCHKNPVLTAIFEIFGKNKKWTE